MGKIKWTEEKIHEEALKYETRKGFMIGSRGAYDVALRRGVLDLGVFGFSG